MLVSLYACVCDFFVKNGYVFELLCAHAIFAWAFERRSHFALRFILTCGVLLSFSLFWNALDLEQTVFSECLKYISMIAVGYGGVRFCTKTNFSSALFCSVGGSATQHCAYRVVSVILSFTHNGYDSIFAMVANITVIAITYSTVFFIFARMLKNAKNEYFENRINVIWGLLLIVSAIIMHLIEEPYGFMYTDPPLFTLLSVYGIMCCVFSLGLEYSVCQNKEIAINNAILEHLLCKQKENYQIARENMDMINIKCHDMKQQISTFKNRINSDALQEIQDIIQVYDTCLKTGNEALDVLLTEKSLLCEKNSIKFNCIVDGESLSFMKPTDIFSLFGNGLDNAIEALTKVEDREKRIITLTVRKQSDMLIVHIENYFSGSIDLIDGVPHTTKHDENYHGFGIRSMRLISERYGGNLAILVEDEVFNLNIIIPIPG